MRALVAVVAACGSTAAPPPPPRPPASPADYQAICAAIADDIETLDRRFAQLAEFKARTARTGCHISYERHTHRSHSRGGWSAGVPEPDPDGVWFYIGIWDPADPSEAMSQINTQPVLPPWTIGDRKVTFLILEGDKVTPASAAIVDVLRKHGLTGA